MLSALLPTRCPVCHAQGPAPCAACWRQLKPAPPGQAPAGVVALRSLLLYDGAGRELVARVKYRNERSALRWLATGMAALVRDIEPAVAVVTWAPTTRARQRARGFDQAELLARAVARELALPARSLLRRMPGPPQTGRPASERAEGVAFVARSFAPPRGAVLLVDDVTTTGATLTAAATALHATSAKAVVALTAARTPLKISG